MDEEGFDEEAFFRAIARSQARALLIGRQALIAIGIPVVTHDYDFWLHVDDVSLFNTALAPLGFDGARVALDQRTPRTSVSSTP